MKHPIYIIIIVILCLVASFSVRQCNYYHDNYNALHATYVDSVTYFQARDKSQVATIHLFEGKIKDLKVVNDELYKEINNLKLKAKNVQSIVKYQTKVEYVNDTTYIITTPQYYSKDFDFSDKWRILKGNIRCNNDTLDLHIDNKVFADYTIVFDKNNKLYLKSDNPYIQYNEISGWTVPKQKTKRWGIGPNISVGYDPLQNKPTWNIGIGLQYNIIRF